MSIKISKKSAVFVVLIYVYTFRNIINSYISIFQYADELLAAIGLFVLLMNLVHRNRIKKDSLLFLTGISLFVISGLFSSFLYKYQPFGSVALPDLLLSTKFFLWIYLGVYVCQKSRENPEDMLGLLARHAGYLLFFLFILTVFDIIFHLFNQYVDIKMGMRAVGLYEGAASLASTAASLMCFAIMGQKKLRWSKEIIYGLCVLMATLRFKSLAAVAVFVLFFFYGETVKKRIKWWHVVILGFVAVFVAKDQIAAAFTSGVARYILFIVGFRIMKDYFPFGTGFGTYASYYSKVRYSPVYGMYHISSVYGLTQQKASFVNDTFWPMVFGQTGLLGTLGYCMALYWIFSRLQSCMSRNISLYYGGMYALLYLLITSAGESAFLHWNALLFALIFGIIISYSYTANPCTVKEDYHEAGT